MQHCIVKKVYQIILINTIPNNNQRKNLYKLRITDWARMLPR